MPRPFRLARPFGLVPRSRFVSNASEPLHWVSRRLARPARPFRPRFFSDSIPAGPVAPPPAGMLSRFFDPRFWYGCRDLLKAVLRWFFAVVAALGLPAAITMWLQDQLGFGFSKTWSVVEMRTYKPLSLRLRKAEKPKQGQIGQNQVAGPALGETELEHRLMPPDLINADDLSLALVLGPGGTGKTKFMEKIVAERRREGRPALYVSVLEGKSLDSLLQAICGTTNKEDAVDVLEWAGLAYPSVAGVKHWLCGLALVLFDGLPIKPVHDYLIKTLEDIQEAHKKYRPLIVIDNIDPAYGHKDEQLQDMLALVRLWSSQRLIRAVLIAESDHQVKKVSGMSTRLETFRFKGASEDGMRVKMTHDKMPTAEQEKWLKYFGKNLSGQRNLLLEWNSETKRIERARAEEKLSQAALSDEEKAKILDRTMSDAEKAIILTRPSLTPAEKATISNGAPLSKWERAAILNDAIETRRLASNHTLSAQLQHLVHAHETKSQQILKEFSMLAKSVNQHRKDKEKVGKPPATALPLHNHPKPRKGVTLASEGSVRRDIQELIAGNPVLGRIVGGRLKLPSRAAEHFAEEEWLPKWEQQKRWWQKLWR